MPIQDRDYVRGSHPPTCSCVECTKKRLSKIRRETYRNATSDWPTSREGPPSRRGYNTGGQRAYRHRPHIPNWLKPMLLIAALSIGGLIASHFVGSLIPFWLFLGFSVFYSVEKWLSYYTRRYKGIGRLYRLILNLSALSLLGLLVWSGKSLFTQQFMGSPLMGSLVFLFEIGVFVWLCQVVSRNDWRQPSMKLTIVSLICLFLIFSFAGVQPLSHYKDILLDSASAYLKKASQPDTIFSDTIPSQPDTTPSSNKINSRTGSYKNYYLGLVHTLEGYLSGSGCYDDAGHFIVLINNENAVDPSYSQLVSFLRQDRTDQFPYIYTIGAPGIYYGKPESHVNLEHIQTIIDGIAQPGNPHICADFAERLHNNAEMAGIRCAYVSVTLAGYTGPYNYGISSSTGHACNAFQTTDRGLVYIDCTGMSDSYGPDNNDKVVDVQVGEQYNPEYLFPSGGWYIPSGTMGRVTGLQVIWEGTWNN